jgi:type IV pilus assembly protein PilM
MAKENRVLTIDVGGDNLKMAEFSFLPGGGIVLTGFAFRRFDSRDESEDAPSFAQVYGEMLIENNFTARGVRLSLAAQNSFQRLSKLPPMLGSGSSISKVVEYEARQTVPYLMSEVEWGYQLIHHQWQESTTETNEDGTTEEVMVDRSEYEALFVAMKTDEITKYTDVIENSGRKVLSVDIAPVALFNAAKAAQQVGNDECVLLLNIGGSVSSLMIADHNRAFMRSIPIGGNSITAQIAKEFGISAEEAEELKRRHGFVALGGAYEDPESELAATISKIARTIMTRLHGEVSRSINVWRAQHGGSQPTRVLLSGGGSTMLYVTDFFQEKLRCPVSYLNTFGAITIAPEVNKDALQLVAPMFQELIGMSLRSVTQCPIDISLLPRIIRDQRELDRKKPYLFASAAGVVICLCVLAVCVLRLSDFEAQRGSRTEGEVNRTQQVLEGVKALVGELNSAKGEFEEAYNLLKDRNKWAKVMEELQRITPDNMWYVVVEGVGDENPESNPDGGAGGVDEAGGMATNVGNNPFAVENFPITGASGLNDSGDGNSTTSATTANRQDLREIKRIRLVGYTLELEQDNQWQLQSELAKKLKDSELFAPEWKITVNRQIGNMSGFEIFLQLKEPIRK